MGTTSKRLRDLDAISTKARLHDRDRSEIAHELGGRTHRYLDSLAYIPRHVAIGSARKRLEAPGGAHTVPFAASDDVSDVLRKTSSGRAQ